MKISFAAASAALFLTSTAYGQSANRSGSAATIQSNSARDGTAQRLGVGQINSSIPAVGADANPTSITNEDQVVEICATGSEIECNEAVDLFVAAVEAGIITPSTQTPNANLTPAQITATRVDNALASLASKLVTRVAQAASPTAGTAASPLSAQALRARVTSALRKVEQVMRSPERKQTVAAVREIVQTGSEQELQTAATAVQASPN